MFQTVIVVPAAYAIDLILGDPAWLPHPVRGVGRFAKRIEPPLRMSIKNERLAGSIFAIIIIASVYLASFGAIMIAGHFNRYFAIAISILLVYTTLAVKDLKVEAMSVYNALANKKIDLARKDLSMIVGRQTQDMSDGEIVRAAVETVAENTVDGIIAPLFYAFLGGAPLALAYKAASTLDSTVGYKNEKYINFGWAAAKIDDFLNFIPARLAAIIMPLASAFAGLDAVNSFRITLRDRKKNPSPNSGIPEAAVAGALNVRLGGLNFYKSGPVMKPFIGDDINVLVHKHIKDAIRVAGISAVLTIFFSVLLMYLLHAIR